MMHLTEEMVAHIAQHVLGTLQVTYQGQAVDLTTPWQRLSLAESLRQSVEIDIENLTDYEALWTEVQQRGLKVGPQATWGKLVEALFGEYVEPHLIQPTFIHTYPIDISPFSKQSPENPNMVERFEVFVGGREIGNAYSELNDPLVQRQRFEAISQLAGDDGDDPVEESHPIDDEYVTALMYGMPPTGGLGVGIDRLTMLLTDQSSIREVILFPTLRSRSE
jgi:lysyl-tRNA synthetase class 2